MGQGLAGGGGVMSIEGHVWILTGSGRAPDQHPVNGSAVEKGLARKQATA
jgi:hypothetical protein